MSLAYKLWKIGNVLSKEDIKKSFQEFPEHKDKEEPVYLNIDFTFIDRKIDKITLDHNAISKDKLFFSKKAGGSGTGIFYLYPNIAIFDAVPKEKLFLLENTLRISVKQYCKAEYSDMISEICDGIIGKKNSTETSESCKKYFSIFEEIANFEKGYYWIWFSINNKTFYELMPEIFDNWFKFPFFKEVKYKKGFDAFINEEVEVGYNPEIKVFSYDQYHSSLVHRMLMNLPLSSESAKKIKFAWLYVLENLVFNYKGLEYIIIPNLLSDDNEIYKIILERLVKANENARLKDNKLSELRKEESKLEKNINKVKDELYQEEIKNIEQKIFDLDKGIIHEFHNQVLSINEHLNSITIDYIFVSINKTDLSFEIKGSIEGVIPSFISKVVTKMDENNIDDLIKIGKRDQNKTFLQDYFGRNELYFILNRSVKNNFNKIVQERLYLAKLLLTETKIKFDDLLHRIELNRLNNYEQKKRITKDGILEWIEFTNSFTSKENYLIKFMNDLNKIKEIQ